MISVVCVTYGRTRLLEEMIQSFLIQDCPDRHLFILNDHPAQKLCFDHPMVTIVNDIRYETVGDKRNAAVAMADGDWLAFWDDDDIYLPNHLSKCLADTKLFVGQRASKQWVLWVDGGHKLYRIEPAALMHTLLVDRQVFLSLGGYPSRNRNHDIPMVHALLAGGYLYGPPAWDGTAPTCIYRTSAGVMRLTDNAESTALFNIADDVAARGEPLGCITLNPHWRADYAAIAASSFAALP